MPAASGVLSGILGRRFPVPTVAEESVDLCKCILFFARLFVDFFCFLFDELLVVRAEMVAFVCGCVVDLARDVEV